MKAWNDFYIFFNYCLDRSKCKIKWACNLFSVDCSSDQEDVTLDIRYLLRESPCAQEYDGMEDAVVS